MTNIFFHEIKQNRSATIIWTVALVAIAALYISIFPTIAKTAGAADLVKNFPEAFKKTFGITDDFFSAFPSLYALVLNLVLLTGAVQAMNLGTGVTSREVRDKTADFLLTKPVSRGSVLRQKLLAIMALLLLTDAVFLAADWGLIQALIDDPFQFRTFIVSSLSLAFIQSFFVTFGFLLGSALPKVKSVIAVSLPVVFGFYVFGLLDTVIGEEKIKFMTPFKFFDVHNLTAGGGYEPVTLIYLSVLVMGALVASFVVFQRRDIHTI
jgi:ABC-2 type transport system permease protein